jgi:hypothetical protein
MTYLKFLLEKDGSSYLIRIEKQNLPPLEYHTNFRISFASDTGFENLSNVTLEVEHQLNGYWFPTYYFYDELCIDWKHFDSNLEKIPQFLIEEANKLVKRFNLLLVFI